MNYGLKKSSLISSLSKLGVKPGIAVEVHASLSSFGYIENGAATLIEALIQSVGQNGSIIMPSFRLSKEMPLTSEDRDLGLTVKIKILDKLEERSGMGIISDTFRKRADVITGKGVFRVSAWGKDAAMHSEGFQHLIDIDGWALLLGVDIYRLSSMHYVEDVLPLEIRNMFKPSSEARILYPEDKWLIEAWQPRTKPWYEIMDTAYKKGLIRESMIGNAKCMLFKVKPVIELYRLALIDDPFGLYGLN